MDVRELVTSGSTYALKRQARFHEQFQMMYNPSVDVSEFVLDCLQLVLNNYPTQNPPTLSLLSGPISAMSSVCGLNVRDLPAFKNFIRGYKKKLVEVGKTKNLTCPVFLDHAVDIHRKLIISCPKNLQLVYKFVMLMKLYFGIRTADVMKIRYGHLRFLKTGLYTVGSDGRKGCSSVDSPTVYFVYRSTNAEFCLFTVVDRLSRSGLSKDAFILTDRIRRKSCFTQFESVFTV